MANATLAARYPYYRLGHSTDKKVADAAVRRLSSRYTGAAYQFLVRQTAGWPPSVRVSLPDIRIDAVTVAADEYSAVLTTRETWRVTDDAGRVLFAETNHPHTIRMSRVRGVVLHKWVVTAIG